LVVAEPLDQAAGVLDVGEQQRDRAVGRARAAQVGLLGLHPRDDPIDRAAAAQPCSDPAQEPAAPRQPRQ